jgi:flavorubredoxin
MISDILKAGGFELMDEGLPALWNPDEETIARCIAYGRKFAARLK